VARLASELRYAGALSRIESLGGLEIGPVSGPASSDVYLLHLVIHEGVEFSVELTGELSTKIFAKASASGDFLAAKVSGEAGAEAAGSIRSANTYKRNSHTTRNLRIRINLSKPSYFYQLKTDVQLTNDRTVTLWGGYFASSYPLKQALALHTYHKVAVGAIYACTQQQLGSAGALAAQQ
jgi:hypothetical protein